MVKLVVGSESGQRAHPDRVREEDLCGPVDPGSPRQQLGPVDPHVVGQSVHGAIQGEGADQEDSHHKVGEQRRKPDDLNKKGNNIKNISWQLTLVITRMS